MKMFKYALLVFISLAFAWVLASVAYYYHIETKKSDIQKIVSISLTMNDVYGELPPEPPAELRDATVAGIDTNKNHIRDDVERTLREKYAHDEKLLAATLQYAQGIQVFMTVPTTGDEVAYASGREGRGSSCIHKTMPGLTDEEFDLWLAGDRVLYQKAEEFHKIAEDVEKYVYALVVNTEMRKKGYMSMYKLDPRGSAGDTAIDCDIFNEYED